MASSVNPLQPSLLPSSTSPSSSSSSSSKSLVFPSSSRRLAAAAYNPLSSTHISFTHSSTLSACFNSMSRPHQPLKPPVVSAASGAPDNGRVVVPRKRLADKYPTHVFFFIWFILNVIFNILNKKVYNYFPYPYFVSVVHLLVGVVSCLASWGVGLPKRAPMNKELLLILAPVALFHALGHVMSNVSFAAVAVSFTHTVKALEPFFHIFVSQFVLGNQVPVILWQLLAPVVFGVSMASLTELSFNWTGFVSAMISNIAFTYRSNYSKKATKKRMDSTNVYAYISIIALIFCIPPAVLIEGPQLMQHGFRDAIAKVGLFKFLFDLFWVGMFYHLYNQLATSTLERVGPLIYAFGDLWKRVFVIGFSIMVLGNRISIWTGIGTAIAMAGFTIYSMFDAYSEQLEQSIETLHKLGSPRYSHYWSISLDQGK